MDGFNDKVNNYFDWLKKSAVVEELPDGCFSIATPFMDSHNDGLVVYVSRDGDTYKFSDDAYLTHSPRLKQGDSGRNEAWLTRERHLRPTRLCPNEVRFSTNFNL
mgnify:CR=1 FL=1